MLIKMKTRVYFLTPPPFPATIVEKQNRFFCSRELSGCAGRLPISPMFYLSEQSETGWSKRAFGSGYKMTDALGLNAFLSFYHVQCILRFCTSKKKQQDRTEVNTLRVQLFFVVVFDHQIESTSCRNAPLLACVREHNNPCMKNRACIIQQLHFIIHYLLVLRMS